MGTLSSLFSTQELKKLELLHIFDVFNRNIVGLTKVQYINNEIVTYPVVFYKIITNVL